MDGEAEVTIEHGMSVRQIGRDLSMLLPEGFVLVDATSGHRGVTLTFVRPER